MIKKSASEAEARALVYIAVCEVCDFFNVGKNMSDIQVALTVDLILESYWYMKLEEIKFCFRRAIQREKLFDRLDGNIILGWIREYDAERTEEAIRISEQKDREELNVSQPSEGAMSFREYLDKLEDLAAEGDEEAILKLEEIKNPPKQGMRFLSKEERDQKEKEFKTWRMFQYLPNKKQ